MNVGPGHIRDPVYKIKYGKTIELEAEDGKTESSFTRENALKDLHTKNIVELEELLSRQEKILNNKSFLRKLKDKGEKLKQTQIAIQEAIAFVRTNNNAKKVKDIQDLEWRSQSKENDENQQQQNDRTLSTACDETANDETNPLSLMASHSLDFPPNRSSSNRFEGEGRDPSEAILKELQRLDIQDKDGINLNTTTAISHSKSVLEKTEASGLKRKEPFKPFRPLRRTGDSNSVEIGPKIRTIPVDQSLKLMDEAMKTKATSLQSSDKSFVSGSFAGYRDLNQDQHFLESSSSSSEASDID